MTMRRVDLQPTEPFTADFIDRAGAFNPGALEAATAIIEEVRAKGDAALRAYTEKFDGVAIDDSLQQWWCVTKGGESVNTGVDTTPIEDGDHFELTLTTGY